MLWSSFYPLCSSSLSYSTGFLTHVFGLVIFCLLSLLVFLFVCFFYVFSSSFMYPSYSSTFHFFSFPLLLSFSCSFIFGGYLFISLFVSFPVFFIVIAVVVCFLIFRSRFPFPVLDTVLVFFPLLPNLLSHFFVSLSLYLLTFF